MSRSCRKHAMLLLALSHVVRSESGDLREQKSPIVHVETGQVQGTCGDDGICSFLGVPYAKPPVADLRWRPPQPAESWEGVLQADKYRSWCAQISSADEPQFKANSSEDCLFLHVWAPRSCMERTRSGSTHGAKKKGCSVMLFIHGGAYVLGAAEQTPGKYMVDVGKDVVFVGINYRLGVFGFLGSDKLRDRDPEGSTGNYGILDQRLAMQWVQHNIDAFGGDRTDVMIFGESAGGGSVNMHLVSPKSWPLYTKVGIESGAFTPWTATSMKKAEYQFAKLLLMLRGSGACKTEADDVACLLSIDTGRLTLIGLGAKVPDQVDYTGGIYAPKADGVVIEDLPWRMLDQGKFNTNVPVLLGFNQDEGTIGVAGLPEFKRGYNMTKEDLLAAVKGRVQYTEEMVDEAMKLYALKAPNGEMQFTNWYWAATHFFGDCDFSCGTERCARAVNQHSKEPVFMYYFSHYPKFPRFDFAGLPQVPGSWGVSHADELPFVFDARSGHQQPTGADELRLATTMAAYWTNFAKHGDPNPREGDTSTSLTKRWPAYEAGQQQLLQLTLPELSTKQFFLSSRCALHNKALLGNTSSLSDDAFLLI
eukprot:TRINITY_DN82972_c0_g1_i1.p1 TRINITY_DN82972_c0_g1~~TRINITY_DN82972_c0_g1_i1.p1  ORF type:complete len:592 (+),score=129.76 TRINITY_DN82972_c0_g1_i1:119-1894(+)